MLVFFRLLF